MQKSKSMLPNVKNYMTKDIQKKLEIGTVKKQDILENQANIAYLSLGSNLSKKKKNLELAKALLNSTGIKIICASSYYKTKSWPNINFPDY